MSEARVFDQEARALLLAVKGVGPTVVLRFEQLGIATLAELAGQDAGDMCERIALMMDAPCWRNAPRARAYVAAAIEAARNATRIRVGAVTPPA